MMPFISIISYKHKQTELLFMVLLENINPL